MNIYHKALILESNFRPTLEISEPSDKTSAEMVFTSDPASFAIPAKGETANEGHHFGCLTLGFVGKMFCVGSFYGDTFFHCAATPVVRQFILLAESLVEVIMSPSVSVMMLPSCQWLLTLSSG